MNIINSISHFFTKENVTFILSIFGSIGTLFTFIRAFFINRKHINMKIHGHRFGDTKMLTIYASFENLSRLPISITDICIRINDVLYPCVQPPIIAYEEIKREKGVIVYRREYSSLSIPINISSLGGSSGYICFEFPPSAFPTDATELTFLVSSNRGKVIERKFPLGRLFD